MNTRNYLTQQELEGCLSQLGKAKVGLIGDLCLDMYWVADMKRSQLSRETPHYPLPVVEERYQPGGAGNVACNIAALEPEQLWVVGAVGADWRGSLLIQALEERGIDSRNILRFSELVTNTYIKPLRTGISDVVYEDPRLDFENRAPLKEHCENVVLDALEEMAKHVDVICVSDQMEFGIITPRIREALCALGKAGKTIVVDSRDRASLYENVILKPNETEASRAYGVDPMDVDALGATACAISRKNKVPTLITLGSRGCLLAQGDDVIRCPAYPVEPPLDFCGAGDTFLSGFGTALAAGIAPQTAAAFANLCSAVTVKKVGTTGTATKAELLEALNLYA